MVAITFVGLGLLLSGAVVMMYSKEDEVDVIGAVGLSVAIVGMLMMGFGAGAAYCGAMS